MRLIDAKDTWNNRPEMLNPSHPEKSEYNKGWNACIDEFYEVFKNAPTVDAEPVVRCKDCWRREKLTDNKGNVAYVCKSPLGLKGMVHDNDFCCNGERGIDNAAD